MELKKVFNKKNLGFLAVSALSVGLMSVPEAAHAASSISDVSGNVTDGLTSIVKTVKAIAYTGGIITGIVAAFKFKAHSDDARSTPLKTPIMYLIVAGLLVAVPNVLGTSVASIWGDNASVTDSEGNGDDIG